MQYKKPMLQEYGALATLTRAIGGSGEQDQSTWPVGTPIPEDMYGQDEIDNHGSFDFCASAGSNDTPDNDANCF